MTDGSTRKPRRVGVWLIGARGSISTCVSYGLAGLEAGILEPVGLATACEPLTSLPLARLDELVVGGHDICNRDLGVSAGELVEQGILQESLVRVAGESIAAIASRIRLGPVDGMDRSLPGVAPEALELSARPPRRQIERIVADLREFRARESVDAIVVVNLASTECVRPGQPEWTSLPALERALDEGRPQPASIVYAYAALASGCAYVNFTPSLGSSIPALRQLAVERGVPHCGNDGKTGETLVKTVLAALFRARNLRVHAWQGYNMLGNRDGEVLTDEAHRAAKLRNKDEALRSILEEPGLHTRVGIDFVPSLRDWKTAWDFIHFEGFLGVRMSLQFTWSGSDSALAAPLVLDLIRLADFALQRGEKGEMTHTASYFKAPVGGGTHDFRNQFQLLLDYAEQHRAGSSLAPGSPSPTPRRRPGDWLRSPSETRPSDPARLE